MADTHNFSDIFISYSRRDADFVRRLFDRLADDGRSLWIDWEDIPPTVEWWQEIEAGIRGANTFILIMSPDSIGSPVCQLEIAEAIEDNKRIIPIIYRDTQRDDAFAAMQARVQSDDFVQSLLGQQDPLAMAENNWQVLAGINWLFARDTDDFDAFYNKLITALDTDLNHVRMHTRLLVRADEWAQRGKSRSSFLLIGDEITDAETWLAQAVDKDPAPTGLQAEYIAVSRAAATRRQRVLQAILGLALIGALAFSVLLFMAGQDATQQRIVAQTAAANAVNNEATAVSNAMTATVAQGEAEVARNDAIAAEGTAIAERDRANEQSRLALARQIAAQAGALLEESPEIALLLAIESTRVTETQEGRDMLFQALQYAPQVLYSIRDEAYAVEQLAFSPDGRTLAANYDEKIAAVWDVETGRRIGPVLQSNAGANALHFAGDDRLLVRNIVGNVEAWQPRTGAPLELPSLDINTLTSQDTEFMSRFSGDGSRLIAHVAFTGGLVVEDVATGIESTRFTSPSDLDFPLDMVMDTDGNRAVILQVGGVWLWREGQNGFERITGADTYTTATTISPDGETVAYATLASINPPEIVLRDAETGDLIRRLTLTQVDMINVSRMVYSSDGSTLFIGLQNGTVMAYDLIEDRVALPPVTVHNGEIRAMALSPDARLLATGDNAGRIVVWDLTRTDRLSDRLDAQSAVMARFLPDGRRLLMLRNDSLALYDTQTETLLDEANADDPDGFNREIIFHPDGQWAVTLRNGEGHEAVELWRIGPDSLTRIQTLPLTEAPVAAAFSPDGRYVFAAGVQFASNSLRAFQLDVDGDSAQLTPVTLPESAQGTRDIAIHPGRNLMAVGGVLNPDMTAEEMLEQGITPNNDVDTILIYDLEDGLPATLRQTIDLGDFLVFTGEMTFSSDGRLLAVTMQDEVAIWDVDNGERIGSPIITQAEDVYGLAFNPDASVLATADRLGRVLLRDTLTGQQIGPPLAQMALPVQDVAYAPDGRLVAAGSEGVLLWRFDLTQLQRVACARANEALSPSAWTRYLPDLAYRVSCPQVTLINADLQAFDGMTDDLMQIMAETTTSALAVGDTTLNAAVCAYGALMLQADVVLPACDRAVADDADNALYHDFQALALSLAGRPDDAAAALETADRLAPDDPRRARWLAALERGDRAFDWRERDALRRVALDNLPYAVANLPAVPLLTDERHLEDDPPAKPESMRRWFDEHDLSFAPYLSLNLAEGVGTWAVFGGLPAGRMELLFSDEEIETYTSRGVDDVVVMAYNDADGNQIIIIQSPLDVLDSAAWFARVREQRGEPENAFTVDGVPVLVFERGGGGLFSALAGIVGTEAYFVRDDVQTVIYTQADVSEDVLTAFIRDILRAEPVETGADFLPPPPDFDPVSEAPHLLATGHNSGEIVPGGAEIWQFEGQAGQVIMLETRADWDTVLVLYGPGGAEIRRNDDGSTLITTSILFPVLLPEDGLYTVEISGFTPETGGDYALYLWQDDQIVQAATGQQSAYLRLGGRDVWQYNGRAGEVLNLDVIASFATTLDVFGPGNRRLDRSVYYFNETLDTVIRDLELPEDGIYTFLIEGSDPLADSGMYNLTVRTAQQTAWPAVVPSS